MEEQDKAASWELQSIKPCTIYKHEIVFTTEKEPATVGKNPIIQDISQPDIKSPWSHERDASSALADCFGQIMQKTQLAESGEGYIHVIPEDAVGETVTLNVPVATWYQANRGAAYAEGTVRVKLTRYQGYAFPCDPKT